MPWGHSGQVGVPSTMKRVLVHHQAGRRGQRGDSGAVSCTHSKDCGNPRLILAAEDGGEVGHHEGRRSANVGRA